MTGIARCNRLFLWVTVVALTCFTNCKTKKQNIVTVILMNEKQISFSDKNHFLDNNDNFSPDMRFLCYDTRGTVFDGSIGNSKTIEKIEISTGIETVLYHPESETGEKAAPGVGAVSWYPSADKAIFIHGPDVDEIEERGYYGITNRSGVEVSTDGKQILTKVDQRDVSTNRPTTPGAQRGGTHRHEYSRNGQRIGFTYDDFLNSDYDRTIAYLEQNINAPVGYSHYFALILKPAEKGKSKPGEIEKASGDSWVDPAGTMRAFVGKVRAENGVDYQTDLFIADIPKNVDITTSFSGNGREYPRPPVGIKIRRLTHSGKVEGVVRGSFDGSLIAYLSPDNSGVRQVFIINSQGSDLLTDNSLKPRQLSKFSSDTSTPRWHPEKNWLFTVCDGNIAVICAERGPNFGKTFMLTNDRQERAELVVSHDGNTLAYSILTANNEEGGSREFRQIFVLKNDWDKILESIKSVL